MEKKLYFITLTPNYLAHLGSYENKISTKIGRPYIGIVLEIDNKSYFAPLSSPKEKHKNIKEGIDLFKINDGKLGVINLNNMIPVINDDKCRNKIDLKILNKSSNEDDKKYFRLLKKQLTYCEKNKETILYKASKLYDVFTKDFEELTRTQKLMHSRINNFKVLEYASKEFEEKYINTKENDVKKEKSISKKKDKDKELEK